MSPTKQEQNYNYGTRLKVGSKIILVEVAKTSDEMKQGLSGREKLSDNQGMLFDFGQGASQTPGFWMKDMNFSLDFIWIKDKKIIGITPNVPAPGKNLKPFDKLRAGSEIKNLKLYYPPSSVDSVLEINAGWTEKNHITNGDVVDLEE